ncbi:hypothetical protein ACROYT_G029471 [Oculina patagonica]
MFGNPMPFLRHQLSSAPIESKEVEDEKRCIFACVNATWCRSVNFKAVAEANGKFLCHLLDADKFVFPELFSGSVEFHHYSLTAPCEHNPCLNGGTCHPANGQYDFKCACQLGLEGKRCNVSAYQSCAELLSAGYDKSGVYMIKNTTSEMFPVYCDQTSRDGGWTMVFKLVSGVSADIYQLWTSADSLNENNREALNVNSSLKEHYKNRLVQNWQSANLTEARVVLYSDKAEVLSIVFNATDSDNENWFSYDRLIYSPWTDLDTEPRLYFSIQGYSYKRQFYIMRSHGGCDVDAGWLVVTTLYICSWETIHPPVVLLYSKPTTYTPMAVTGNVGVADVFAVYIR